ncbi:MAG: rhamnulokinase [Clostridiales bacterium]|nr:rhamnulokinase [Clostridiales bacterium]
MAQGKRCLAVDIGASSGRHIVGWMEEGELQTREVYRFPNGVMERDGHLTWDMESLFAHVVRGMERALAAYPDIATMSIDTWGVDYVLLRDGEEVSPCHAYRDHRTEAVIPQTHALVPFETLYAHTGCQFQPFNTIYQLMDDLKRGRLEGVTGMLMIPEYLMYRLTGVMAREYTNATTTGLVDAKTGEFDLALTDRLGLPRALFPALSGPGTALGALKEDIAQRIGGSLTVVLCATHDTGSAVEGIPMEGNQPYISSGTWSLLGVKTERPLTDSGSMAANYSNEGGVGYNRYQKNIMGMWLVNELRRDLCPDAPFGEIVASAQASDCALLVDANAPAFLAPKSMKAAFDAATGNRLRTPGDYFCCAYRSLAASYRDALDELERNTGKTYDRLYIVGGGAKNEFLNQLTQEATGKQVVALPIEATALGNLKIQMEVT